MKNLNDMNLISAFPSDVKVTAGFGTKELGDGRNPENLRSFLGESSRALSFVQLRQLHSTEVITISHPTHLSKTHSGDGIVTNLQNVVLSVITADCAPILWYDPVAKVIGASHHGWKGTLENLTQQMIRSFRTFGSKVENIQVSFGPAICEKCYTVSEERAQLFVKSGYQHSIVSSQNQHFLNLIKIIQMQLSECGVLPQNKSVVQYCTLERPDLFWSYRRDGEIKGEQVSFIYQT